MPRKKLLIIVPVYNERKTLREMIRRVQEVEIDGIDKEILIVNDFSTDGSHEIIEELSNKHDNVRHVHHEENKGKGAALRTGFGEIKEDFVVIQDADLEYDPNDFKKLIRPLLDDKADVVYGSRMLGNVKGFEIASHYYGNLFLSFLTRVLYLKKVTDMETCYKMMRADVIKNIKLNSNKFDIEPEITSKILRGGHRLIELPINYTARSFDEGKKINWKDGIGAVYTLVKYRIFD
jgi:glycosyltransferase involved in cell wall biosynthesis